MRLIVLAKAPIPGQVKTRLCPPCLPWQAAALADAALRDTIEASLASSADEVVIALRGPRPPRIPAQVSVVAQRGRGLDERLAAAFEDVRGPALLIGMDTPQVTAAELDDGLSLLRSEEAVLGQAEDGGFWAIGLRRHDERLFLGVPMSTSSTGRLQRERLLHHGLRVRELAQLRDVDTFEDALAVAALAPGSRFAGLLSSIEAELPKDVAR